jgi:PKD repeat protein
MKSFHTAVDLESPMLGKYRLKLGILTLFLLFFASSVKAQGPCDQISFSMDPLDPCEFAARYQTQTDCYIELRFILTSGEFASYTVNSDDGFMVQEISPSELWITHEFGFIPTGNKVPLLFTLPYDLNTSMSVAFDNACAQLGCEIIGGWPLDPCPDPQNASIIGVKYKECGSLPYINQTPISGWLIQLLDADGNVYQEQETGVDGAYAFYDLPKGQYIVREAVQPGWTSKVPASGEYLINLDFSEQRIANFGNCPPQPLPCDCPAGTNPGGNLAQNGNFSGSGGFSTSYTLNNNPTLQAGEYWIGTNPSQINAGFASCGDHTTGSGNMMVVNGAANQNTSVWCQTFTMAPNSSYKFEGWIASLSGASPAQLNINFQINNVIWSQQVFAPTSTCNWEPFCFPWTNGPNPNTVTICLVNQNVATSGNDFALDDISFRRCVAPGGNLSGVVYRECDGLPYTDQPVLSDWTVQLLDTMGNVLQEQLTDADGAYAFDVLPPLPYWVKTVLQPGWTANVPANGQYTIELITGDSLVRDFGVCPGCSCDSITTVVHQAVGNADTSIYFLSFMNSGAYCFPYLELKVETGELLDWTVLESGWQIEQINNKTLRVIPPDVYLSVGAFTPMFFRANGIGQHNIIITTGTGDLACARAFSYPNPPISPNPMCCLNGATPGPELVVNGDFSTVTAPGSDYTFANVSGGPGTISINTQNQIFNTTWQCVGKTGPGDAFLVVDGSLSPGKAAWKQQVNVNANATYVFCAQFNNLFKTTLVSFNPEKPVIRMWIEDVAGTTVASATPYTLAENPDAWINLSVNWATPNTLAGPYTLKIATTNLLGFGNDFAIDCISFRECSSPQPCFADYNVQFVNNCGLVQFNNLSMGSSLSYNWNFGDNQTSTQVAPTHQYTQCGTYNVCLTISGPACPPSTLCQQITISDPNPPSISCPSNITVQGYLDPQGNCNSEVTGLAPTASDDCLLLGGAYVINNGSPVLILDASGVVFSQGTTTVTYIAADWCLNTSTCSFTVTVECGDCVCQVPPNTQGPELVVNGGFSTSGGFTSGYTNNCTNQLEGQVCVSSSPQSVNAGFTDCDDVPTGTGGMLVVNGATTAGVDVWCQTFTVSPSTDYFFTYYHTSLTGASPAQTQVFIGGSPFGSIGQSAATPCVWRQNCMKWTSGSNQTSVTICIRDINLQSQGNDFALDLISFRSCTPPQPCQASINITQNSDCTVTVCAVTTGAQPIVYQWCDGRTDACFTTFQTPCVPTTYCVTATCADGTTSSATVVHTVTDVTPPQAVCNLGLGIDLGVNCNFQVTPAFVDGGSTDNCGIQSMSVNPTNLAVCTNSIVTLTVTDWCGNVSTCTMGIQTTEGIPPVLTCPPNAAITGVVGPNGLCTAAYSPTPPLANDNCDPSVTLTNNAPTVFQQGPNVITWTGTDDCDNSTTCSYTVTVQCDSCGCPIGVVAGPELVVNGDFENGVFGFGSDYTVAANCSPGTYNVLNGPQLPGMCSEWAGVDHTSGTGYMLAVDGSQTLGEAAWRTQMGLFPSTQYDFCAYVNNLNNLNHPDEPDPIIEVWIVDGNGNGVILASLPLPESPDQWVNISAMWTSPPTLITPYNLEIRTSGTSFGGNNFAVDDISFKSCGAMVDCCEDPLVFNNLVAQGFSVTQSNCNFSITAPQFDPCYFFSTPPYIVGGPLVPQVVVPATGSWSFNFTQNGTYQVCATVFDDCNSKLMCTTVVVDCDTCFCGSFSQMFARPTVGGQSIPLACGGTYNFPCPAAGQSIAFTGKFECQGNICPDSTQITWGLLQPDGTILHGTIPAGPYFYLPITPLQYSNPGTYTLALLGNCDGVDCPPCLIHFTVDCPDPCPCDVPQFQKDVAQGFATALWNNSCKGCFSPIALNDCDMVSWQVNGGPILAMTNGNQSFCYTFTGAGTHTVTMIVSRKKSDGSPCETFTFSKSVAISCLMKDPCDDSVFPNARFSQGGVAGGLNSGGASTGWKGLYGDPQVLEGQQAGSTDGWAVLLSGHVDAADVMSHDTSRCLKKGSGVLNMRTGINTSRSNIKRIAVFFNRNDSYVFNVFNPENCHRVAELDVSAYDSSWFDLEIPYDLSTWIALDSCGDVPHGVKVRPIVYVTSPFESVQGGDEIRTCVTIDHICFDAALVGIEDLPSRSLLRIYPNPNPGTFTVEMPEPAQPGTQFRIIDLRGRLVQEQKTEPGSATQTVRASSLPAGLYFLQVVAEGKVLALEKFVKQ